MDAVRVCIGPVCDCLGAKDLLARENEHAPTACPCSASSASATATSAPVLLRGDAVEPEVVHRTNDGPSIGLARADATLADYEARGGLAVLRALPSREHDRRRAEGVRPRRLRRRGLPDRREVGGGRGRGGAARTCS